MKSYLNRPKQAYIVKEMKDEFHMIKIKSLCSPTNALKQGETYSTEGRKNLQHTKPIRDYNSTQQILWQKDNPKEKWVKGLH